MWFGPHPSPLPQGEGATLLSGVFNVRCDRGVSMQEFKYLELRSTTLVTAPICRTGQNNDRKLLLFNKLLPERLEARLAQKTLIRNVLRKNNPDKQGLRVTSSGFSLLELTIVIVIISVLLVVAISRLLVLLVDAERVTMETTAGVLRSALGMKVAQHIVRQKVGGLRALEGSNPMDQLAQLPPNYLGERHGADPQALEDGNWYFDADSRQLVYLVRHKGYFSGGLADPPRAVFAVRLVYADLNGNGVYDAGVDEVEGLRLAAVKPYTWKR